MELTHLNLWEVLDRVSAGASVELLEKMGAFLRAERAAPSADASRLFPAAYAALLTVPTDPVCPGRVVSLLCIATHHYATASKAEEGLAPAADAVTVARRLGDPDWLCKALKIHGVLLADTGNVPGRSMRMRKRWTSPAKQQPTTRVRPLVTSASRTSIRSISRTPLRATERAVELAGADPVLQAARKLALSNIANAALELGDIDKGLAQ